MATVTASVLLFIAIPKGFFPQQDTGLITGTSEAAQDVSFRDMLRIQQAFGAIEMFRLEGPDGSVGHAELKIGDSSLMLGSPCDMEGGLKPSEDIEVPGLEWTCTYVNDTDTNFTFGPFTDRNEHCNLFGFYYPTEGTNEFMTCVQKDGVVKVEVTQ